MKLVIEKLKQRWIVKKASIESCKQRVFKFRQNLLFEVSQTQKYKELNGKLRGERVILNSAEIVK